MLSGACHCGDVRIELPAAPRTLIDCNCSICRRNGAWWALWDPAEVRVHGHPQHTTEYLWGPRTIRTLRCSRCGCVTHWEPLQPAAGDRIGVNMRNFDPAALAGARTRRFDGADRWAYLDPE
jgi:hypothetical protein